jgi:uncharacterized protein with HEPN domain
MSRDPLRLPDYLDHILEAIHRIQDYCEDLDETGFQFSMPQALEIVWELI